MDGKKVLIYEDDPAAIDRLESWLQNAGIEPVLGPNSDAAIEAVRAIQPDLIVLSADIKHGFSACLKLKKDKTLRRIPLLIVSGRTPADVLKKHQRLPTRADAYLAKPLTDESLNEVLRDLLPQESRSSSKRRPVDEDNLIDNMAEIDIDDVPDRTLVSNRGFEAAVVNFVEDEVRDLKSTVNRLQSEKHELNGKIGDLESMLRNQSDILDSGMKALREHQENLMKTTSVDMRSAEEINRMVDQAVRDAVAEALAKASAASEQAKAELEKDLADARSTIDEMKEAADETADLKKQIRKLEKTLEECRSREAALKEELEGTSALFTRLESGYKENLELVEEERTSLLDRLAEADGRIDELRRRIEDYAALEAEYPSLQEAAARAEVIQEEHSKVQIELTAARKRIGELESAMMVADELKAEIDRTRASERAVRAELEDLRTKFVQVRRLLGFESPNGPENAASVPAASEGVSE